MVKLQGGKPQSRSLLALLVILIPVSGLSFLPALGNQPPGKPNATSTATPIPANCAAASLVPAPTPDFVSPDGFCGAYKEGSQSIPKYLNEYGPMLIEEAYKNGNYFGDFVDQDLTGDGIPEIGISSKGNFSIYSCINGEYKKIFSQPSINGFCLPYFIVDIQDGNKNGIPEILFLANTATQGRAYYQMFEWENNEFKSRFQPQYESEPGEIHIDSNEGKIQFQDNGNGVNKEILVKRGVPLIWSFYIDGLPWRQESATYTWNGQYYSLSYREFAPPDYQFQAVHDADLDVSYGKYEQALAMFIRVINDNTLKSWSNEIKECEQKRLRNTGEVINCEPLSDPEERPSLAAYSRFRMLWIYLKTNRYELARMQHKTLLEEKSSGIFSKAADILWDEFADSKDLDAGCVKVQNLISQNPSLFFRYIKDAHGDDDENSEWPDTVDFGYQASGLSYSANTICPLTAETQ